MSKIRGFNLYLVGVFSVTEGGLSTRYLPGPPLLQATKRKNVKSSFRFYVFNGHLS